MKQSILLILTLVSCSLIFVLLMWAPFTYALTLGEVVKYAFIGAMLGGVFYLLAVRKALPRRKVAVRPTQQKNHGKKSGKPGNR